MAHFAKISEENKVLSVHVVHDNDTSRDGEELEDAGQSNLQRIHSWPANLWIKCSYNTYQGTHRKGGIPFRGNYPSVGWDWDLTNEIFIPEKPYPSWTLNIAEARWQSPIGDAPALSEEEAMISLYGWNEATQAWDLINTGTTLLQQNNS
jgi:hypothetical protein